jgi:hypothetical protein
MWLIDLVLLAMGIWLLVIGLSGLFLLWSLIYFVYCYAKGLMKKGS